MRGAELIEDVYYTRIISQAKKLELKKEKEKQTLFCNSMTARCFSFVGFLFQFEKLDGQ